jgi:predicted GH43/DUF377 family glycosyl hydrolase
MKWKKLGKIFCADNNSDWMATHASNPFPYILDKEKEIVRVFFSARDKDNRASVGSVDVDFKNGFKILKISDKPVLSPGNPGYFDDSGVSMSWIIKVNNKFYLYFLGWNLRVTVPWLNTIGLAISDSIDGPFEKYGNVPLLDRSNEDPFTVSYPCVIFDNGIYKMWYGSNLSWGKEQREMAHVIKYAESADAINWKRTNQVHIPFVHKGEYALSKPGVLKMGNAYKMWYSYRASEKTEKYRIGMAESTDCLKWIRKDDEAGIDVSAEGWDSTSVEYPNVFELNNKLYMLYNGNDYGKTGFGIAIAEQ